MSENLAALNRLQEYWKVCRENAQLTEQITIVQARCTALLEENRRLQGVAYASDARANAAVAFPVPSIYCEHANASPTYRGATIDGVVACACLEWCHCRREGGCRS